MKQIKFLLSLAVALLIVVPVLAQDAAWGVSGNASATFKYKMDGQSAEDSDTVTTATMDDVVVDAKFNATGDVSPYIRFQYDLNDENRFWLGGSFKKGNFAGEVNVKFDGATSASTITAGTVTSTVAGGAATEANIDTAWVSYKMDAFEFKFDKGGVHGTGNTFKTTYTMSDTMKFFVGLSRGVLQSYNDFGSAAAYYGTELPVIQLGTNITAGTIKLNADVTYAEIKHSSAGQVEDSVEAMLGEDMVGQSFTFLALQADVTATLGEGMSVKAYGSYFLNGDTFGNDKGATDAVKPNEVAAQTVDADGFADAVGMKAGLEAKAMMATLCVEYTSTMNGASVAANKDASGDEKITADTKLKVSVAYDIKVGEMTVQPKFEYVDNMDAEKTKLAAEDDEKDVDMSFMVKASVAF